jgi:hypothetical protein
MATEILIDPNFQTPLFVAQYMVSLIPEKVETVLEPTPGLGNIVNLLDRYEITAPVNYFEMPRKRFDCIVMNPPFSSKYAFGVPEDMTKSGMRLGYQILLECMEMSDNIIALMPWFTISDSDVRLRAIKSWGLKSVTALPRKTFQYARIQTMVLEMQKDFKGTTDFKVFDLLTTAS